MLGKEVSKKQEEQLKLVGLVIIAVAGYYFFMFLPEKREEARKEINRFFRQNSTISPSDLDSRIWKNLESWEEYLDGLYFSSQIKQLTWQMKKEIRNKAEELARNEGDKIIEERKKAIKELEDSCTEEEKEWPTIKKILENYSRKIDQTEMNNISSLQKEATDLIIEERVKKQKLHWRREKYNWVDKKLMEFKNVFNEAWTRKQNDGVNKATFAAPYTIFFSPSLWNELTDEEKGNERAKELELDSRVDTYEFNDKIMEWYNKVERDPIRGEKDPETKKDNNALFYGTGGTGKSITAEKLAYKADKYPLVVIQGSALTPKLPDQKCNIAVFEKFVFTIADITWTLVDDFNFKRDEGGEVRYILCIDEADQISQTSFIRESSGLTFLKECMGSDNYKKNESWNLWIMTTNHLDKIDPAVYRPGRLSNPLDFSWTLGDFMKYADNAGISSNFPQHWMDDTVLNDEDNKWVNRFNKDYFDADFLPFWEKFIAKNPNAEYEPENEDNTASQSTTAENNEKKKIKIKWGEMFEFFWRLKDSSQLEAFDGKFTNPRKPKIEEVVDKTLTLASNQISRNIDIRLKGLDETAERTRNDVQTSLGQCIEAIDHGLGQLSLRLEEIGKKI